MEPATEAAAWQAPCSAAVVVNDDNSHALTVAFARWGMDLAAVRTLVYRAPTPRERERWHALWLLARGWTAAAVAGALERDRHTIGEWRAGFCRDGPASVAVAHTGGPPRPERGAAGRAEGGGAGVPARGRDRGG